MLLGNSNMEIRGNVGEWSELYVLIKLLSDGVLYQSDINLCSDSNNAYQVIKAFKDEANYSLEFDRVDNHLKVYRVINDENTLLKEYTFDDFNEISKQILDSIKTKSERTFSIPNIQQFLSDNCILTAKASSNSKVDIRLRIYDHRLASETELGFSIKSLLGRKSTLFNTGPGNNFRYEVKFLTDSINIKEFNESTIIDRPKIVSRINKLNELGTKISFDRIDSRQLQKNLKMIDGDLPEVIAWSLYYRYLKNESSLSQIAELLEKEDPLDFYETDDDNKQRMYVYKLKKFLAESAMGMTSENIWLGEYDSFGGVIVAKNDGDIVCFHIYDFNLFRNYLLNNTKFEQASTGENESQPGLKDPNAKKKYYFGWLYKENESHYIKLNLQIRFN
ncbi:HpaII family restriction endonuclease [Haemophilus sp. SZY H57]